jgi:hypothetical protein
MSQETENLIAAAREHQPTAADKEEHRRSFAYGNTNIENSRITRELIDRQAELLEQNRSDDSEPKTWR